MIRTALFVTTLALVAAWQAPATVAQPAPNWHPQSNGHDGIDVGLGVGAGTTSGRKLLFILD